MMKKFAFVFLLLLCVANRPCNGQETCWDLLAGNSCSDLGEWQPDRGCLGCDEVLNYILCLNRKFAYRTMVTEADWNIYYGARAETNDGFNVHERLKVCAKTFDCDLPCVYSATSLDYECVVVAASVSHQAFGYWEWWAYCQMPNP